MLYAACRSRMSSRRYSQAPAAFIFLTSARNSGLPVLAREGTRSGRPVRPEAWHGTAGR